MLYEKGKYNIVNIESCFFAGFASSVHLGPHKRVFDIVLHFLRFSITSKNLVYCCTVTLTCTRYNFLYFAQTSVHVKNCNIRCCLLLCWEHSVWISAHYIYLSFCVNVGYSKDAQQKEEVVRKRRVKRRIAYKSQEGYFKMCSSRRREVW